MRDGECTSSAFSLFVLHVIITVFISSNLEIMVQKIWIFMNSLSGFYQLKIWKKIIIWHDFALLQSYKLESTHKKVVVTSALFGNCDLFVIKVLIVEIIQDKLFIFLHWAPSHYFKKSLIWSFHFINCSKNTEGLCWIILPTMHEAFHAWVPRNISPLLVLRQQP